MFALHKNIFKIKIVHYLLFFGLLILILFSSCTYKYNFITKDLIQSDNEKFFSLDSVRIVEVIDNRKTKDSLFFYNNRKFEKKEYFPIDKPFTQYLKESFNNLIVKDSSLNYSIPIKITVNDFFAGIIRREKAFHKYSYIFEYPVNSMETKKVVIVDSLEYLSNNPTLYINTLLTDGLYKASIQFKRKYNYIKLNYPDIEKDTNSQLTKFLLYGKGNDLDSEHVSNFTYFKEKSGVNFYYFQGKNIYKGYRFGILVLGQLPSKYYESGASLGLNFLYIKAPFPIRYVNQIDVDIEISPRYNFSKDLDGFFVEGNLGFCVGKETYFDHVEKKYWYYGPNLREQIGFHIVDELSITLGSYQLYHFNASYMKYDYGYMLGLNIAKVFK